MLTAKGQHWRSAFCARSRDHEIQLIVSSVPGADCSPPYTGQKCLLVLRPGFLEWTSPPGFQLTNSDLEGSHISWVQQCSCRVNLTASAQACSSCAIFSAAPPNRRRNPVGAHIEAPVGSPSSVYDPSLTRVTRSHKQEKATEKSDKEAGSRPGPQR